MPKSKGWAEEQSKRAVSKERKLLGLEVGRLMVGKRVIVSIHEHDPEEVSREWFLLNMEVTEHLIAVPVDNQIDDVTIDAQTEEVRGISGA